MLVENAAEQAAVDAQNFASFRDNRMCRPLYAGHQGKGANHFPRGDRAHNAAFLSRLVIKVYLARKHGKGVVGALVFAKQFVPFAQAHALRAEDNKTQLFMRQAAKKTSRFNISSSFSMDMVGNLKHRQAP